MVQQKPLKSGRSLGYKSLESLEAINKILHTIGPAKTKLTGYGQCKHVHTN